MSLDKMKSFVEYGISGALGGLTAYLVTCALFIVATQQMFSIMFAVVLLLLACCFLWRLFTSHSTKGVSVWLGAIILVASAIAALAVKTGTVPFLSHTEKIPLFALLGASCAFAFAYSAMELALLGTVYCAACAKYGEDSSGVMRSISGALLAALAIGTTTGANFGAFDVEDGTPGKLVSMQAGAAGFGVVVGVVFWFVNVRWLVHGRTGYHASIVGEGGDEGNVITLDDDEGEGGL